MKHTLNVTSDRDSRDGFFTNHIEVEVDETEPGYALGTLYIYGTPMHLECIEVEGDDLRARNSMWQENLDALDTFPATTSFDGREWVVLLQPHAQ